MTLWNKDAKKKGEQAETRFQKWLNNHNINYLYIKQDLSTFPNIFEGKLKSPDFVILLPDMGFIMVDVKRRSVTNKYNDIPIDAKDLEKYTRFQNKFHIPIWYAISNETLGYKTWFWIPVSKILGLNPPKLNSSLSKQDYFPIELNEFVEVKDTESLAKIFSKSF